MSSPAQIAANRANAQLSTGPKTDEGKAKSSRNNFRNGLNCRQLYIPPDMQDTAKDVEAALRNEIRPEGELQETLFFDLVRFRINILRCLEFEANLFEQAAQKGVIPFLDPEIAPALQKIQAYRAAGERGFYRSMNELRKLQSEQSFRDVVLTEEIAASVSPLVNTAQVRSQYIRERHVDARVHLAQIEAAINAPLPGPRPATSQAA